jgi:hypothetical protein
LPQTTEQQRIYRRLGAVTLGLQGARLFGQFLYSAAAAPGSICGHALEHQSPIALHALESREAARKGLNYQILQPGPEAGQKVGVIACRERLGGLLKYYHRTAA